MQDDDDADDADDDADDDDDDDDECQYVSLYTTERVGRDNYVHCLWLFFVKSRLVHLS